MGLRLTLSIFLILGLGCHTGTDDLGPTAPHQSTPGPTASTNPDVGRHPQLPEPPQPPTSPGPVEPPPFEAPDTPPLLISSYQPSSDIFAFDPDFPEQMIRLTPEDPTQYGLREETSAHPCWFEEAFAHFEVVDGHTRALFKAQPGTEPRLIRSVDADQAASICSNDGTTEAWLQDGALYVRDLRQPEQVAEHRFPGSGLGGAYLYAWSDGAFLLLIPKPGGFEPWSVPHGAAPIAISAFVPTSLGYKSSSSLSYSVATPQGTDLVVLNHDGRVLRFPFLRPPGIWRLPDLQNKLLVSSNDGGLSRASILDLEDGSRTDLPDGLYGIDTASADTGDQRYVLLKHTLGRYHILDMQTKITRPLGYASARQPFALMDPTRDIVAISDYELGGTEVMSTLDGALLAYWPTPPGYTPQGMSEDMAWILMTNSNSALSESSILVHSQTGQIQTFSTPIAGFLDGFAVLLQNKSTETLVLRQPGLPDRPLAEDLPSPYRTYQLVASSDVLLTAATGEIRLIDPVASDQEKCRASLPGFDIDSLEGPKLWFRRQNHQQIEYAVVDTSRTPCTVTTFTTPGYRGATVHYAWNQLFITQEGVFNLGTSDGNLIELDLPFSSDARFTYEPSDPEAIWVSDEQELFRLNQSLEILYQFELSGDYLLGLHHTEQATYIATRRPSGPTTLYASQAQGSTVAVELPQQATWHWSAPRDQWRPSDPQFDSQGRLLALASNAVKAFSASGEEEVLLESELHPPISLFVDEGDWYAPTQDGVWLGNAAEPLWLPVAEAVGLRSVRRLTTRYLSVSTRTSFYLLDKLDPQIIFPPEGLSISQHISTDRYLGHMRGRPVVWHLATNQVQPILPRSPARNHVRLLIPPSH